MRSNRLPSHHWPGLDDLVPGLSWTSGKVVVRFRATGSTDLSRRGVVRVL